MRLRRILGDDVERELWPVLATVALGFTGVFSFVAFFSVWAVGELGAPPSELGIAFTAAAAAGVLGALSGGRLSDALGRRVVIVAGALAQTGCAAALLIPSLSRFGAYGVLVALSFCQPLRGATQRALVADVVRPTRLEGAFAAWRVAVNLGASLGPLAGAALVTTGWTALHAGTTGVFALSLLAALRLPRDRVATLGDRVPARAPFRDRLLWLVVAGAVFAWVAYQAFETLLPVSLTRAHGLQPAVWGVIFAVNPVLTVALQLRLTRWTARFRMETRLGFALLLIGWPFLALAATAALPVVVAIVVLVTVGEMLWAPAAEKLVVDIAPVGRRGTYLGATTAANWLGTAIGPACGLAAAGAFGDTAMWSFVAVAAAAGALVYRRIARRAAALSDGDRRLAHRREHRGSPRPGRTARLPGARVRTPSRRVSS